MNFNFKSFKKFTALLLVVSVLLPVYSINTVIADEDKETASSNYVEQKDGSDYEKYIENTDLPDAEETDAFLVDVTNYISKTGSDVKLEGDYNGEKDVLVWESAKGEVSYKIDVKKSALYYMDFTYLPLNGNGSDVEFELKIDGKYPFSTCRDLKLIRYWVDSGEPSVDDLGNEFSSEQKEYGKFITKHLCQCNNIDSYPLKFALEQGEHTLTIVAKSQGVAVFGIAFTAPDKILGYSEYKQELKGCKDESPVKTIIVEGEDADLKSTRSLVGFSADSDYVTPSDSRKSKLNYIGGSNWSGAGEELVWNFNVEKSGWYKFGFSFKQETVINGNVYRSLLIDGKSPFTEAQQISFGYSTEWQFKSMGDKNDDYSVYLTAGNHTLTMTVTLGEVSPVYKQLKETVREMGELYVDIIMITGENPDTNRDYNLFKQLPEFTSSLEKFSKDLNVMSAQFEEITGQKSNQFVASFNNAVRVMDDMLENPYKSHLYIKDFYTQYTTLGSLLSEIASAPLSLDQIQIVPENSDFVDGKPNFFQHFWYSFKRFVFSFVDNYNYVDSESDSNKQIKIWINWGRDQAMVLDSLIKQSFTPKTGISVNLEMTNASLIKGMLSNTQPDLQLHISRTEPVNLAMRDALYDLKNFDDFEDVTKRFVDGATVPYTYKNGVYALPDTQNFYLMFYRKDIFEKLGLQVPQTWDEFLAVTANIERNNMTVALPYTQITATTTVNTGVGGLNLFPSILQQFGGKIYNDELNGCMLKDPVSLSAFTFWTDMYTKYKIPTTQNFFNRFKVGTCPLGIDVYTMYTQLSEAAPEIDGAWGIALVPGTEQSDGTVNRTVSGSGSGCCILNKSQNKEAAWEFLKWWTSADTQLSYNNNVESILGPISRTTTATVEAFERMSWDADDLSILLEQRNNIVEVPEVPGGYYLTRSVDQAFWQVINKTKNVKDALVYWSDVADNEIARKIKQYS